jgi:hypothetical protein
MSEQIGDICEKGILKGFYRKGFTPEKCLNEIIANVYDALDKLLDINYAYNQQLLFDVQRYQIRIIDNGSGMSMVQLHSMWSLHKENHSNDESRGVSGVGVKPATVILSKKTVVHVYTRTKNSDYLCCTVPWGEIYSRGKYTEMISAREMTEQERELFIKERQEFNMVHNNGEIIGTTFVFNNNDLLENTIKNAFDPVSEKNAMKPLDRPSVVFGMNKNKTIRMKHYESRDIITMKMYDTIYSGEKSDYFGDVDDQIIVHYYSDTEKEEDVFVWEKEGGEELWIGKHGGKGYNKILSKAKVSKSYRKVQEYQVRTVIPYEKELFDDKDELMSASNYKFKYNEHDIYEAPEFLYNTKLVRNGMTIGTLPVPDKSMSSTRADWKTRMFGFAQQTLSYRNVSVQDIEQNRADKIMNIQENKNQHNGDSIPKPLSRLLQNIRQQHVDNVVKKVEERYEAVEQPESPVEQPESPVEQPESPVEQPESPVEQPESPVEQPESPVEQPETPVEQPETPVEQPETPVEQPETPVEQPETPVEQPTPHDVSGFRRGGVYGRELIRVLKHLVDNTDPDKLYTTSDYISCYNQVSKIA